MTSNIKNTLTLPAQNSHLHVVSDKLAALFAQAGLSSYDDLLYNVQLAVQEICANIVKHAYAESESAEIHITLEITGQPLQVLVETRDWGKPFNTNDAPEPDLDQPQVHGYGLFLARQLMDQVLYHRDGDQNIWELQLAISD